MRGFSKWRKFSSWFHRLRSAHALEVDEGNTTAGTLTQTQASSNYLIELDYADTIRYTPIQLSAFRDCTNWSEIFPRQDPGLEKDVFFSVLNDKKHFLLFKYYPSSLPNIYKKHDSSRNRTYSDSQLLCIRSDVSTACDTDTNLSGYRSFQKEEKDLYHEVKPCLDTKNIYCETTSGHSVIKRKVCDKLCSIWETSKAVASLFPKNSSADENCSNIKSNAEVFSVKSGRPQIHSPQCGAIQQTTNFLQPIVVNPIPSDKKESHDCNDGLSAKTKEQNSVVYKVVNSELTFSTSEDIPTHSSDQKIDLRSSTPIFSTTSSTSNVSSRENEAAIATWKQVQERIGSIKIRIIEKFHTINDKDNAFNDPSSNLLKEVGKSENKEIFPCSDIDEKLNSVLDHKKAITPSTVEYVSQNVFVDTVQTPRVHTQRIKKMQRRPSDNFANEISKELLCTRRSLSVNDATFHKDENIAPIRPERKKRIFKYDHANERYNFPNKLTTDQKLVKNETGIEASKRAFIYTMIHPEPSQVNSSRNVDYVSVGQPFLSVNGLPQPTKQENEIGVYDKTITTDYHAITSSTEKIENVSVKLENDSIPKLYENSKKLKWPDTVETSELSTENYGANWIESPTVLKGDGNSYDSLAGDIRLRTEAISDVDVIENIPNDYAYTLSKLKEKTDIAQILSFCDKDTSNIEYELEAENKKRKDRHVSKKKKSKMRNREKRSVDISYESGKDLLIFTSKLDIEIIKNSNANEFDSKSDGSFPKMEPNSLEEITGRTVVKGSAINCDIEDNENDYEKLIKNDNDRPWPLPVFVDDKNEFNYTTQYSSPVKTQTSEISYVLNADNLHFQPNVYNKEREYLYDNNMYNNPDSNGVPDLLLKSDSQPQIFITPSDSEKCKKITTCSSNGDSNLSHSYDIACSTSVSVALCSVESRPECPSLLSEIDGLFPNDAYSVTPCLTPSTITKNSYSSEHRPTTPKSPITVQEWVDSLPIHPETSEHRDDEQYDAAYWRDDELNFVCEESKKRQKSESIVEETLLLGDEAAALASILPSKSEVQDEVEESFLALSSLVELQRPPPPLTLKDIHNVMSKSDADIVKSWHGEVSSRRSQFADARDKQASFQSEASFLSYLSHQTTASSIESILESRQADPVDILLNLGFGGGGDDDVLSRIPARFLKPSKVPGNDIHSFLKQEDNISDLVDSSDWVVPGISAQALRKSSLAVVSPLVTNLLESLRRNHASKTEVTVKPLKRFASLAKGLGRQASLANAFSKNLQKKNKLLCTTYLPSDDGRVSVLMPENRLYLDQQDRECTDAPKKRIILGSESFSIGCNDEIIYTDEKETPESEKEQNKTAEEYATKLLHRDSVASLVSSTTSIDSHEEELLEELHQLRLSLIRKPQPLVISGSEFGRTANRVGQSSFAKKKSLIKRLSAGSKRKAFASQSSSSSWEMENQITEEEIPNSLYNQVIIENLVTEDLNDRKFFSSKRSDFESDLENNVFESGSISETNKCPSIFQFPHLGNQTSTTYSKARSATKDSFSHSSDDGSVTRSFDVSPKKKRRSFADSISKDTHSQQQNSSEFQKQSPTEAITFIPGNISGITKNLSGQLEVSNKITQFKNSTGNWSMESGKSFETVKHFPLTRNFAVYSPSVRSDSHIDDPGDATNQINKSLLGSFNPDMRRTSSLPTVLVNGEETSTTIDPPLTSKEFSEEDLSKEGEENIKATLQSLQKNFNTAMLAVLQTCKMQSKLQDMLSRCSSVRSLNSIPAMMSDGTNDSLPCEYNCTSTSTDRRESSKSKENVNTGYHETLDIASRMKASVNSIMSQMEHYLTNIAPTLSESQPDISDTIGQMLWLSHHQNQLCSELERISSPEVSVNGIKSPRQGRTSLMPWTSYHPNFYRSMPDHLNSHYPWGVTGGIASPPSAHSASPFYGSPFPPFAHSTPALNTPHVNSRPTSRRLQNSLSESSCEESCELGENSYISEWNEGKQSNISSPACNANSQWPPQLPSEVVIGDIVRDKISQEMKENIDLKVNQMTSNMSELHYKMDQNFKDVAEIREKLDFLIDHISSGKRC